MQPIRKIVRHPRLVPLVARYAAAQTTPLTGVSRGDGKISLLALNASRYGADLAVLDKTPGIRVLTLPETIQDRINFLFTKRIWPLLKENRWEFLNPENRMIAEVRRDLQAYLEAFLPAYCKQAGIDAITTCTFYYLRDRDWEAAAKAAGIPFITMHKENMKDEVIIKALTEEYRRRRYRFNGHRLAVYNNNERRCVIDGEVAEPGEVEVTGCPRLDDLFTRRLSKSFPPSKKVVTLFSFRHLVGGLRVANAEGGFVPDRQSGFVELFENVHATFAQMAQSHPDWTFYIKPKWMERWSDEIEGAIERKLGRTSSSIENLVIGTDRSAQQLIEESKVVVGLNSTAVIEARIAGRDVIVPYFAEAKDRYRNRVYFQKYFGNDLLVATSAEQLVELTQTAMRSEASITPGDGEALFEEFFGSSDGRSGARVAGMIENLVTRTRQAGDVRQT